MLFGRPPPDPSSVPISVAGQARASDILSLVESAGWAYALADIERLIGVDPEGMLVATAGRGRTDEVLGCVYASRWGSLGFIGLLLVRADMRGRGLGGRLAREGVSALRARGCACVGLDAVPEAATLYSRLGFVPDWESMRLAVDTSVEERPPASVRARAAVDDDMAAVLVLDRHGWGADRSRLLQLLYGSGTASVAVAPEEGPVRAFGVLRRGVRGWRMGPWVAEIGREGGPLLGHGRLGEGVALDGRPLLQRGGRRGPQPRLRGQDEVLHQDVHGRPGAGALAGRELGHWRAGEGMSGALTACGRAPWPTMDRGSVS